MKERFGKYHTVYSVQGHALVCVQDPGPCLFAYRVTTVASRPNYLLKDFKTEDEAHDYARALMGYQLAWG